MSTSPVAPAPAAIPNGPGAAALLSAGIGALLIAVFAIAADRVAGIAHFMTFYKPTGPLSGVTTSAVLAWLAVWAILNARWRKRNLSMARINAAALILLALGLLLTFPPIANLF
jgi:hypothetical protein